MEKKITLTLNEGKLDNNNLKTLSLEELSQLTSELKIKAFKIIYESGIQGKYDTYTTVCPKCGKTHIRKNGFNEKHEQRYKCSNCGKTFINRSNTLMFWSKLTLSQWQSIFFSVLDNDSLPKIASKAGISETSAFYNRHKILYILTQIMNEDILYDMVTLDDTYLNYEEKDYVSKRKRGISEDKIDIACAVDIHDHSIISVADRGRPTSKSLIKIFHDKIKQGSVIISDSQRSYHPLMKDLCADWKKIPSGKTSIDEYTLEKVNILHCKLKTFFYGKRGVFTHYLQGYLALFQFTLNHAKYYLDKNFQELFIKVNTIISGIRNSDINARTFIYHRLYSL